MASEPMPNTDIGSLARTLHTGYINDAGDAEKGQKPCFQTWLLSVYIAVAKRAVQHSR